MSGSFVVAAACFVGFILGICVVCLVNRVYNNGIEEGMNRAKGDRDRHTRAVSHPRAV